MTMNPLIESHVPGPVLNRFCAAPIQANAIITVVVRQMIVIVGVTGHVPCARSQARDPVLSTGNFHFMNRLFYIIARSYCSILGMRKTRSEG